MPKSLSQHRHISFTAHYTGYIWYQMGISHPVFATTKGSMRTTLKQRHQMIDEHLCQLIEQHPQLQILEIACGLSPRSWNFRQKFPEIDYRELDLPDMARIKTQALQQIDQQAPEVLTADIFSEELDCIFQMFDPDQPLVVINEGLINYFDQRMLRILLQGMAENARHFPALHYLSDIYPEPVKNKLANFIWSCSRLLKFMSRSAFTFHFKTPQELQHFFQDAGFNQVEVQQPQRYFAEPRQQNLTPEQDEHLGDLVWMIHAVKKNSVK